MAVAALLVLCAGRAGAGSYDDFFTAIQRDRDGPIIELLKRGFDPNTRSQLGEIGLFLALRAGSMKAGEALMRHPQTEVDAANLAGETPLMMAALRGHLDWCKRLVARGAVVDREGWAPLHYAASGPSVEVVVWLLAQGARVEARAPNGNTPLMMAAGFGPEVAAEALLRAGADVSLRNQDGLTAAAIARRVGRDALAGQLDRAVATR